MMKKNKKIDHVSFARKKYLVDFTDFYRFITLKNVGYIG